MEQLRIKAQSLYAKAFHKMGENVKDRIALEIGEWMRYSPEYEELTRGYAGFELGVVYEDIVAAFNDIVELIQNSFQVKLSRGIGRVANLAITINIDIAKIAELPSGSYITEKGKDIPWLKSMLYDGLKVLVTDFHFLPSDYTGRYMGRTGGGIMIGGGVWRMPEEVAGTVDDNFVTRTLLRNSFRIRQIIEEEVK